MIPKVTIGVILSGLHFTKGHSRLTMVPFQPLTHQGCRTCHYLSEETLVIFELVLYSRNGRI